MNDLEDLLGVVAGASGGIGEPFTDQLIERGARVLQLTRRPEELSGESSYYAAGDEEAVNGVVSWVNARLDEGSYERFLLADFSGWHEPMYVEEDGSWRWTRREDFSSEDRERSMLINAQGPLLLLERLYDGALRRRDVRFSYLGSSSAAADPSLGLAEKGNPLYGPAKEFLEEGLREFSFAVPDVRVRAFRIGLVETPMGEKVYESLVGRDAFVHRGEDISRPAKPFSEVAYPPAPVAADMIDLVLSGSERFAPVDEGVVQAYQPSVASLRDAA